MHAAFVVAAHADAGAVDLGEAVDIVELDPQFRGDAAAHFLAPAFRADDALFEMDLVADAAAGDFLRQQQSVGRCGA